MISAASLKDLTSPAASWPVMASTTSSVSLGWIAACTSRSSLIMRASICAQAPAECSELALGLGMGDSPAKRAANAGKRRRL